MTPRILLLVAVVLIAVWLLLFASLSEKAADHDTTRVVAAWGSPSPPLDESLLTTTSTARARTAPNVVKASSVGAAVVADFHTPGQINGYPCGGSDLPSCRVLKRESGGVPTAYNRTGCGGRSCGGLFQFDPVTWIPGCTVSKWNDGKCGDYMGFQYAHLAPVDVQYKRTREVYANGVGCAHWGSSECAGIR